MASVVLFNAARTQAIEDNAIVGGLVDSNGHLILSKHNGNTVDAGAVKGEKGDGSRYPFPGVESGSQFIRLVTVDGGIVNGGGHFHGMIAGLGQRTKINPILRTTLLFQMGVRGTDTVGYDLKAWAWNPNPNIKIYSRQVGPYLYEVWLLVTSYMNNASMTELANWNASINLDSVTVSTSPPSGLIEIPIIEAVPNFATDAEAVAATSDTKTISPKTLDTVVAPTASRINRLFNLLRQDQDYPYDALDILPLLQNNMKNYSTLVKTMGSVDYSDPMAFKTVNGWVVFRGYIRHAAATVADILLFTLPVGWRPPQNMMFPAYAFDSGAGVQAITVYTNGQVKLSVPTLANTEQSLSGIIFNINAYTPLTLTSPFTALNPGTYGQPSIYQDVDGLTHMAGGVTGGPSGNTAIVMPAGYGANSNFSNTETHYVTPNSNGGFAYGNFRTIESAYRPRNNPAQASQYLTGARWIGAGSTLDMIRADLLNGWGNYGGAFPIAQATKTRDGLVLLNGLINRAAGANAPAFILPQGWRPKKNLIFSGVAADNFARVDVGRDGVVIPVLGSAANWMSLDGIIFAAEQ